MKRLICLLRGHQEIRWHGPMGETWARCARCKRTSASSAWLYLTAPWEAFDL